MLVPEPPRTWLEQWASPAARGSDDGPWSHWLPYAWQVLADPHGARLLPTWSADFFRPDERTLCYWGPLLQMCLFRLGWPQPDRGPMRWMEAGRPTEDPTLELIERWWGPHLEDFVVWLFGSDDAHAAARQTSAAVGGETPGGSGPWAHTPFAVRLIQGRPERPEWQRTWGSGSDPLHLSVHALEPIADFDGPGQMYVGESSQAALVLRQYSGWYRTLHRQAAALPSLQGGASWRVTVICEPVGVLGRFRLSRQTGRWFAGQHRWHQLGSNDGGLAGTD